MTWTTRAGLIGLCLALAVGPARAKPDAGLHAAILAAVESGAAPEVLAALAARLDGSAKTFAVPTAAIGPGVAAKVQTGEMQVALTQLSILSGANGHLALQLAQGGRTDVIYLLSGTARLADLARAGDLIVNAGGIWHLRRPLVVWPGASLTMGPGEVLEMDSAAGAFLLSFGAVSMTGATLRGDGAENPGIPGFRPFLLISGQGTLRAENSHFAALGFRGPVAFRGLSVLAAGVMKPQTPPVLAANSFADVFSLSFEATDGLALTGNRIDGAQAAAVSIKGGRRLLLSDNRISDAASGAGIRLSGALENVVITGNVLQDGGGNGLQIDGTTAGLVISGNVVTGNDGAGITLGRATCVTVSGNILAGNATSGLRLTASGKATIADNAILSNGSAGIEVQAHTGLPPVVLADNVLSRNREGLRAAGLGEVTLSGNDLDDQTPRQFAGDFAPWLAAFLSTDAPLVIPAAAGTRRPASLSCLTE